MEFRHLKYFIAVAEELHFGRAAVALHISQPPLTRQIQQLEEAIGVQLFIRTPKGVELTQAGELLLQEGKNLYSLIEQTVERTRRAGQGNLGRIDIAIFGSGTLDVIPKLLLRFRTIYPDVNVVLHTMVKSEQINALRQRRITVGFNRLLEPYPDIRSEPVTTEPIVVAVSTQHPLAEEEEIELQALKNEPMVLFPTGARPNFIDKVMDLCRGEGFLPIASQSVGDAVTGIALVASGFGISLVPKSATTLQLPGVVYRPLKNAPNAVVDLSCIYRHDDESPILKAFLEVVRSFHNESMF
ncbi:LysR substrate-binding domain-containing protein [Noviherbaspirillum sedimenti]|uniref:LysR family transcriptional regulator n=1 Tax=Noviherbaspirillum sedimenti TaxID=2320865 RepID=A0A3A3G4A7_9BURK|nr:LysR substrate-binding domain-containing protein [Noviherbaspirillum sedimenti]RJG02495.1 LysR family transcriptional regulator [Noviherbaspirillum sedimenti]